MQIGKSPEITTTATTAPSWEMYSSLADPTMLVPTIQTSTLEDGDHSVLSSLNSVLASEYSIASPLFQSLLSIAATANASLQSDAASSATSLGKSLSMAVSSERSAFSSAQSSLQSSANNVKKNSNSAGAKKSQKLKYAVVGATLLVTFL